MAPLVLSGGLDLFTWCAIMCAFSVAATEVMMRGWAWATGRRLGHFEEIFADHRPSAIAILVGALLLEFGIRLLGFPVTNPEIRHLRGAEDVAGLQPASELDRFLRGETIVWPVGGFFYAAVVLMILLANAKMASLAAQRAGGGVGRITLGDVLILLALVCGCVYMAATAP